MNDRDFFLSKCESCFHREVTFDGALNRINRCPRKNICGYGERGSHGVSVELLHYIEVLEQCLGCNAGTYRRRSESPISRIGIATTMTEALVCRLQRNSICKPLRQYRDAKHSGKPKSIDGFKYLSAIPPTCGTCGNASQRDRDRMVSWSI